jgi:hypothetical protein
MTPPFAIVILKVGFISVPLFHSPLDLTLCISFRSGLSLIVQFLALAQANFDFDQAAL